MELCLMTLSVVQNLKKNLFFFFFKNDKNLVNFDPSTKKLMIPALINLHFDWSLLCKVYNVWPKKVQRSYISWHWRLMQNLKKKLTCGLENDMRNLAEFHQNTWKCQNWYLHGILLPKLENVWAKNLQRSYV